MTLEILTLDVTNVGAIHEGCLYNPLYKKAASLRSPKGVSKGVGHPAHIGSSSANRALRDVHLRRTPQEHGLRTGFITTVV
jgi:hypothetical protein